MAKHFNIVIIVVLISGAAVWGFQQTQFFTKLPRVFSGTSAPPGGKGRPPFGERNGSMPGGVDGAAGQRPIPGGGENNGAAGRPVGPPITLASWLNVLAYFAIFAFTIMLTYYAELGIRAYTNRREPCVA